MGSSQLEAFFLFPFLLLLDLNSDWFHHYYYHHYLSKFPLSPLPFQVLLNLSNRGVDYDAFKSINDSFLVFDSRLVVDASFCTNDPAIFGAGTLTKFSCGYHADRWSHAHFSSRQVGQELAAALLPMFDPTLEAPEEPSAEEQRLIPLYQQPKIQGLRN